MPTLSRYLRTFLKLSAWVLLLCGLMGSLGKYFWFFDLFSHFVAQYTMLGGLFAFLLLLESEKALALFLFLFAVIHAYMMEPLWKKGDAEIDATNDMLTVLQFNVNRNNRDITPIEQWVLSPGQQADVVILFELTPRWFDGVKRLAAKYPHHAMRRVRGDRQIGVFSKVALENFRVKRMNESKALVVFFDIKTERYQRPVSFIAMHPPPPVSAERFDRRNALLTEIAYDIVRRERYHRNKSHTILVGDLNTTRWSSHYKVLQRVSGLRDAQEGKGYMGTWPSFLGDKLGIAIDHTLVSAEVLVDKRMTGPVFHSDHLPVITTLGIPTLQGR